MKKLIEVLIILILVARCGGGGDEPQASSGIQKDPHGCPIGTFYNTNGDRDLIAVGNTGVFQMERGGGNATGYITCIDQQNFILQIESQWGNCRIDNGCAADESQVSYEVMEPGAYNCTYSINGWSVTVWCKTPGDQTTGNVLNPAMTYVLDGY